MNNNTLKKSYKQSKISRSQQTAAAQDQWLEEEKQLIEEKAKIGYKAFSRDEFLAIIPDALDMVTQSKILELQKRYKELIDRQEKIWAEDNVVTEFNKTHAIVSVDQTYVLKEKINTLGNKDFSLETRQSFKAYHEEETILCIDDIERNKADIWLKSDRRRKYEGIIFDPTTTECSKEYYNLWKGFSRIPQQGDCSKYWDHVKDNICKGDQELYSYVRKWLAYVFQRPDEVHTALVLCGSQGVGKNSFVDPLGILLGSHYSPLSSISELVSNFNYHLKNAVLIHANEALWGGNKKDLGTVKAMITEKYCLIEGKGKDRIIVRNFKHVILSSNEDWPVHLDADDRRFLVIRVSEEHKEDHEYFKAIQEQLNNGGYEALLCDLLQENIEGFNPRRLPQSFDSFDIKMISSDSTYRYVYEALSEGNFCIGKEDKESSYLWQSEIPKDFIYKDYQEWCKNNGEDELKNTQLGKTIKKTIISTSEFRPAKNERRRCYKMPSLKKAREEFAKAFKEKSERIFESHEESESGVESKAESILSKYF